MSTAIEFNHISKLYRLGTVGTGTLSHDLKRWWTVNILRQEDPYLKIGEVNDRSSRGKSDYVWALKDIDFKVEQGDVVGIIGKNGAGKSTLLKILSRVTAPTTGTIRAQGRIGSLLEVGTGFHPEMTGRENIFLNGAILGMSKAEIASKLDEIIDFSGCERYIDTPVKRYSSGMLVRLGFAVAAHLDPEILVVDEVLAVGDAEFQKKAIGKMQDVSRGEGRTVLFVSHNMGSIKALCNNGILLENGKVKYHGEINSVVNEYLKTQAYSYNSYLEVKEEHRVKGLSREFEYESIRMLNNALEVGRDETLEFELHIKRNDNSIDRCQVGIIVNTDYNRRIGGLYTNPIILPAERNNFTIRVALSAHQLAKGSYSLNFNISKYDFLHPVKDYDLIPQAISFEVNYIDAAHTIPFAFWPGTGNISFQNYQISIPSIEAE